jgi:hypothetical protein
MRRNGVLQIQKQSDDDVRAYVVNFTRPATAIHCCHHKNQDPSLHIATHTSNSFTMMFKNTLLALLVASAAAFAPSPRVAFGLARSHTALSMSAEVSDKVRQIIATQLGVDVEKVTPAATCRNHHGY